MRAALKGIWGKALAGCFAVFIIFALGFTGNMVQSNSIGAAFKEVFADFGLEVPAVAIGVVLACLLYTSMWPAAR